MIAVAVTVCCYSSSANAGSHIFTKASFEQIKKQYINKQWLMLLWSVDCPPCFKELALIEKMRQQQADIAIVIVNVDDNNESATERERVLGLFNLTALDTFYFADSSGDSNRYLIDPSWYGELPRSYFVEPNGVFHGKSGLVSESLLINWLAL